MDRAPEESELAKDLGELGLRRDLARVYVTLLMLGRSSASNLVKASGLHRVDAYKKLNELTKLGFGKLFLGRPTMYEAAEPKTVLESLISATQKNLEQQMRKRQSLEPKLNAISRVAFDETESAQQQSYQIIVGRHQGYSAIERVLKTAVHSIQRISSPAGLKRNYKYGLLNEFINCGKRGVKVRIIVVGEKVPTKIIRALHPNIELRHSTEASLPYIIVDNETLIFSGQFNETEMSLDSRTARYLLIRDQQFAKLFALAFEQLWRSTKTRSA